MTIDPVAGIEEGLIRGFRRCTDRPFSVGGGGGGSASASSGRYSLTISMNIRNLLNPNKPDPITGDITSLLFGRATSRLAA